MCSTVIDEDKTILPHHEQLPLCNSRLPYRQGRKLTAVKTYTVNNESPHLLIFGVPSLNLKRESKDLFARFGRLIKFNLMKDYAVEEFTETFHACYDRIQSARIAKKMLDTKNFYGGVLHVCYAPELETIEETRNKLLERKKNVLLRLENLHKQSLKNETGQAIIQIEPNLNVNSEIGPNISTNNSAAVGESNEIINELRFGCDGTLDNFTGKLNMGDSNIIYLNTNKNRTKTKDVAIEKRFKPYFDNRNKTKKASSGEENFIKNSTDIVDCTSVNIEVVSNINEALNYSNFGNEVIKKVDIKPINKIVFNINKKS